MLGSIDVVWFVQVAYGSESESGKLGQIMATLTGNRTTIEINGKPIRAANVAFDPGVRHDDFELASGVRGSYTVKVEPTIKIDRPNPEDLSMFSTILDAPCNRVQLIGPAKTMYQFPQDPFITYELKDESWCRYFGIGKDVEVRQVIEMERGILDLADLDMLVFKGQVKRTNEVLAS